MRTPALAVLLSGMLCGASAEAQTTWARSYGGSLGDRANAIDVVPAGGYVVAGSFGSGFGDAWVLRLDTQGAVVWQKTFGGAQPDEALAVKSTPDGGFVVAGVTHSFGAGNGDAWVLKLDGQGNLVAQTAFGGSSLDSARSVAVVADGYVVAGTTSSFGAGGSDTWAFKLDAQLDVVWSRTYGDAGMGIGTSIIATPDSGLLLGGAMASLNGVTAFLKLDGAGTPIWAKRGGVAEAAVTVTGGGFLILSPGTTAPLVTKVDNSGQHVWSAGYSAGPLDLGNTWPSIAGLADGGFVFVQRGKLFRGDSAGALLWLRDYGGPGAELLRSVAPTADGGYVVAGETTSFGGGNLDAWVVKVNSQGLIEAACPYAVTIAATGGTGGDLLTTLAWTNAAAAATANDSTASAATPSMLPLVQCQSLVPASLTVDDAASGGSNLNRVFEPGEACVIEPGWRNQNAFAVPNVAGTIAGFTGPAGAVYSVDDSAATYGSLASGATTDCSATTVDCYVLRVSNPAPRPAAHWDADFIEDLTTGERRVWKLHIGASFSDVPRSSGFYRFVETLLHRGVTGGCGGTSYCPANPATRDQMAVFVLVAKEGNAYLPPACTTPMFGDVPASSPFCRWIEELARRQVVAGCGGGNYCPGDAVTRAQMAVFVLRTLDPVLDPPACTAGAEMFADVPAASPFCRWVEELARRQIVAGCGGGNYCPANPVTREQMSVFISATFGLTLYGP